MNAVVKVLINETEKRFYKMDLQECLILNLDCLNFLESLRFVYVFLFTSDHMSSKPGAKKKNRRAYLKTSVHDLKCKHSKSISAHTYF